jgi:transcriptional regulator with XRE-family HTH domain
MDFPALFSAALQASSIGKSEFARAVGISPGFVTQILTGERPPPLDRMVQWAQTLKITGVAREKFFQAAVARHVPDHRLLASHIQTSMLEKWLAEERGDTGPWPLDINGRLPESPRAKELRLLRERAASSATLYADDHADDLMLPVVGRAAAADGAHVDGDTAQPDPVRIRSRWRVHTICGTSGGDVVLPGQSVITDPALEPKRNRLVVIPSADGPLLKRWGERHDDAVVVVSINGHDPKLVPLAELGTPEVVVGVLYTDSVAK